LRVGAHRARDFLERAQELVKRKVDVIAIDTAHGHSGPSNAVKTIKSKLPEVQLITGNVATYEARRADLAGVDGIKSASGRVDLHDACGERRGLPQITAISECYKATRDAGVPLIADAESSIRATSPKRSRGRGPS